MDRFDWQKIIRLRLAVSESNCSGFYVPVGSCMRRKAVARRLQLYAFRADVTRLKVDAVKSFLKRNLTA